MTVVSLNSTCRPRVAVALEKFRKIYILYVVELQFFTLNIDIDQSCKAITDKENLQEVNAARPLDGCTPQEGETVLWLAREMVVNQRTHEARPWRRLDAG